MKRLHKDLNHKKYLANILKKEHAGLYVDMEDEENADFRLDNGIISSNGKDMTLYCEYDASRTDIMTF